MRTRVAVVSALLLTLVVALTAWQTPEHPGIEKLAWLSGSWQVQGGKMTVEEHWTRPSAGTMIGMARTIAGEKTVFFEYLRIETRPDGIFYVAHPKARHPGTDFKLVRMNESEVVFENPQHDFPKRVIYRKNADGSVTARIEGDPGDKGKPQEFPYKRMQ